MNKYNLDNDDLHGTEIKDRDVDLLRMRLGTHLTLEKVSVSNSDADDDVIAGLFAIFFLLTCSFNHYPCLTLRKCMKMPFLEYIN